MTPPGGIARRPPSGSPPGPGRPSISPLMPFVIPTPGGDPTGPVPVPPGGSGRTGVGVITFGKPPPPTIGGCGPIPVTGGGAIGVGWVPPRIRPGCRPGVGEVLAGSVPGLAVWVLPV